MHDWDSGNNKWAYRASEMVSTLTMKRRREPGFHGMRDCSNFITTQRGLSSARQGDSECSMVAIGRRHRRLSKFFKSVKVRYCYYRYRLIPVTVGHSPLCVVWDSVNLLSALLRRDLDSLQRQCPRSAIEKEVLHQTMIHLSTGPTERV